LKSLTKIREICTVENDTIYETENGVVVRDVIIDAGIGHEVLIGHVSDIHLNYCNARDIEEADPVLMSTYRNRVWNANAETVAHIRRALAILDDADQIVVNGDTLDYLSHGTMELMDREVWDKCPGLIATVGGHELAIRMQGDVEETTTLEQRTQIIKNYWRHDIYYVSRLVGDKVLVVGMLNDRSTFYDIQIQKLTADLEKARRNGYSVLLFFHEPIATKNPLHKHFTGEDAMLVGDPNVFPKDFCTGNYKSKKMAGCDDCNEATKKMYSLITNSADVVKGVFAAHNHSDMHLDITAHTPDGTPAVITQYINTALAYEKGHFMRILVR